MKILEINIKVTTTDTCYPDYEITVSDNMTDKLLQHFLKVVINDNKEHGIETYKIN
jgi:hypothetical protein